MELNFRSFGQGEPLIILHGVFGSSDNWQTIGKALSQHHKIYLVDQRNHGLSPHSDAFDYSLLADDLLSFMMTHDIERAHIIGHSMGGKTAMTFAARYPEKVLKLLIVDIAPKYYPPHHASIFKAFRSLPLDKISSRKEADNLLSATLKDYGIRQFILKNLTRQENTFKWKLNLDAIEKNAENIGASLDAEDWFNGHVLFVAGSKSDYIQADDDDIIHKHFPNAKLIRIDGAGHWVHAEQPRIFTSEAMNFLKDG